MLVLHERSPSPSEARVITRGSRPVAASYGCLALLFGVAPAFYLRVPLKWLLARVAPPLVPSAPSIAFAVSLVCCAGALISYYRYERQLRARGAQDVQHGSVQELQVSGITRCVELASDTDHAPVICIAVSSKQLLFLAGQWLTDGAIYGAPDFHGDPDDSRFNGHPDPFGFPSSAFVLTRLPHSGSVLGITISGEYVSPSRLNITIPEHFHGLDSFLVEGSIEDLAGALQGRPA